MFVLFTFLMTLAHYKNQNTLILRIGSVYCFCEQNNTHKKRQMICFYLLERNNRPHVAPLKRMLQAE